MEKVIDPKKTDKPIERPNLKDLLLDAAKRSRHARHIGANGTRKMRAEAKKEATFLNHCMYYLELQRRYTNSIVDRMDALKSEPLLQRGRISYLIHFEKAYEQSRLLGQLNLLEEMGGLPQSTLPVNRAN